MSQKIKIFNRKIEWYDIKTKFKKIIRAFFYSAFVQKAICLIAAAYLYFVFFTSRKKFINAGAFLTIIHEKKPFIGCFWHNRLLMMSFIPGFAKKNSGNKNYKFKGLSSNHGDGKFVGKIMEIFGFENIYGSSSRGRKASRGINISSLRHMIDELKSGKALAITPDGPRGPNQKINGEVISLARLANCPIIAMSYSSSRFIQFNSWDKFKFPLPFSKINFYFGGLFFVDKKMSKEEEENVKVRLEKEMNFAQEKSQDF